MSFCRLLELLGSNAGVQAAQTGNYQIVFTFDETLVGVTGGANVASGTGSVSSSQIDPNDGRNYIVNLTAVANAQFLTVTLANMSDSPVDGFTSHVSATVGVLLGDTNGDGVVNVGDTLQVRSEAGNDITSSNFRRDVNADGLFNVGDTIMTRTQSGTALPTETESRPIMPHLKIGKPEFANTYTDQ